MVLTFDEYLTETFLNLFSSPDKMKHKDEVFALLQASYAPIGGLKGAGFNSPDDMVQNVPFWKLIRKSSKIVAVAMYKDKYGRKRVAVGSDGSPEGKAAVASIFKADFSRAYFEISSRSLNFHVKILGYDFIKNYAFKPEDVAKITGDEISAPPVNDSEVKTHPPLKDFFYQREIGGSKHTKILLGTPGKKIVVGA